MDDRDHGHGSDFFDGDGDRPFRLTPADRDRDDRDDSFVPDAFGAAPAPARTGFEWRDTLRILQRRRWPALTALALAMVAAVLHAATRVPTYEAKVRLVIEPQQANVTGLKDPIDEERATEADFQTQFTILQSRSLARRTMRALAIWDTPVPATPVAAPAPPPNGSFAAAVDSARQAVKWITSAGWAQPEPVRDVQVQESAAETAKINGFMGGVRVVPLGGSRIVDVYYTHRNPLLASKYANTLVEQFIQQNLELRFVASKEVADWLSDRLAEQRATLEASEQALQNYRRGHAGALPDETSLSVQKLTELTAAYTKAKTERIEKEALYNQLQVMQRDHAPIESFPALAGSSVIQQMRTQLVAQQQQQAQLSEKLGDRHPTLIKMRESVKIAEDRLQVETVKFAESVRGDYLAAQAAEKSLGDLLETQRRQALQQTRALNTTDVNLTVLQRDAESNRSIYESLLQRFNEFGVTRERRASSNIRVVDAAEVPQVALGTAATRDIKYGFAGGLLLAFCVAFLLEYVDRNIKTPEQIKSDLSLPFLGLVPLVSGKHQENRLVSDGPPATFGEAFRTLRTNVKLSIATDGARTVLVTSACPGDGKTLVASNLAVVLAMTDQKVILIDADLRRPRLHKVFNYPSEPGLSDLLVGDAQSTEIRTTSVPGLHLLTCGSLPPNPSELLDSRRFRHLIEKLGRKYDWIIIDSPPVLPVTDAIVLGETAAAVVLVVAAEQTPMYSARAALEQLQAARAHVIGAVLNRADLKRRAYYYERYYRHEYGQYYTESTSPA